MIPKGCRFFGEKIMREMKSAFRRIAGLSDGGVREIEKVDARLD